MMPSSHQTHRINFIPTLLSIFLPQPIHQIIINNSRSITPRDQEFFFFETSRKHFRSASPIVFSDSVHCGRRAILISVQSYLWLIYFLTEPRGGIKNCIRTRNPRHRYSLRPKNFNLIIAGGLCWSVMYRIKEEKINAWNYHPLRGRTVRLLYETSAFQSDFVFYDMINKTWPSGG